MKRLILMRHAEAAWDSENDFERPLNERGISTARSMAKAVAARGYYPQHIVTSPAKRSFETAVLLNKRMHLDLKVSLDVRIYEAMPQTLLEIAADFSDQFDSVLMVGHNPGFEGLIAFLTGSLQAMQAGSVAVIELKIERWKDTISRNGWLLETLHP